MSDAIAFKYRTGTPWMDLPEHFRVAEGRPQPAADVGGGRHVGEGVRPGAVGRPGITPDVVLADKAHSSRAIRRQPRRRRIRAVIRSDLALVQVLTDRSG
ncbi:hypothetical protein [Streptomyces sp. MT206]|uniref:hypothetical protein n=1 Tax=Streptomyces sp. MT206 TaxID=3031407 RepID=UPI003FA7DF25